MKLISLFSFFLVVLNYLGIFSSIGLCKSDVYVGYRVTLPIPSDYNNVGFNGRAFLMETDDQIIIPKFRTALSVEPLNGRFLCSLQVFIGDFKVWSSAHFSKFYPSKICMLELSEDGDLLLKGSKGQIGWSTSTSGLSVKRLQLLSTGNLVLMDVMNVTKWQSFDFPTNAILWGQRFNFSTRLTSFSSNSTSIFYSFEIQYNKIALYLNSGNLKYSYWEIVLSKNIVSAELGSLGLKFFDQNHRKFAQIITKKREPLMFLALIETTGNLGLYHYSPLKKKFEASYKALNETCDIPLVCGPYGICTFSNTCRCIQFSEKARPIDANCNMGLPKDFCSHLEPVEMVEIMGVGSVLKGPPRAVNVSEEECLKLCVDNCTCLAVVYSAGAGGAWPQCFHYYGIVRGLKQRREEDVNLEFSYFVKVPERFRGDGGKSSVLKKWLLLVGGVVDGLVILIVLGGLGYYFFVIKRRKLRNQNDS